LATYLNEDFESTSLGSLPTGWTSANGTCAVSNDTSFSGSNSLKLTGSNVYVWGWNSSLIDSNNGLVWAECKAHFTTSRTTFSDAAVYINAQSDPSGATQPKSYELIVGFYTSDAGIVLKRNNPDGTTSTLNTFKPASYGALWDTSNWYRIILYARDLYNEGALLGFRELTVAIQRTSDSNWLSSAGTWVNAGVLTPCFSYRDAPGTASWWVGGGYYAVFGGFVSTGQPVYLDDCLFQDTPSVPSLGSLPTWTPGNSAELMGTYTGVDTGTAIANISDGNYDTAYVSTAAYDAWAQLDLGASSTATLTRVLISPETDGWFEYTLAAIQIEGANSSSGPWTLLGTSYVEAIMRYNIMPIPITAGSAYRYFRARNISNHCRISELRFEGQLAGSTTWKPVRPAIAPAAGKFANGSTVTITTPTSGASIYYTTDGSTPTTSSTLYSGAITLPSNAVTTVKAISYHASGTTTTSDVTTGVFTCPVQSIPDTGVHGYGTSNNWAEDLYDDRGILIEAHYPYLYYEAGTYYMYGLDYNTANISSKHGMYGQWLYSSTDLFNWHCQGRVTINSPMHGGWRTASNAWIGRFYRPAIFKNSSPVDPNRTYVAWFESDFQSNFHFLACATSPSLLGPWTWLYPSVVPSTGDLTEDMTGFTDVDGSKWVVYNHNKTNIKACKLDSTTDCTTFTGTSITLNSSANREAPVLFNYSGSYFLITSALEAYGGTTADLKYSAATDVSLSAAASALNSFTPVRIYSSVPTAGTSAATAQTCAIVPVAGHKGFVLLCEQLDPAESPLSFYHFRHVFYPVPWTAITTGGSPALAIPIVTSWDMSSLPASGGVWPFFSDCSSSSLNDMGL
jgi:hypothetical protein